MIHSSKVVYSVTEHSNLGTYVTVGQLPNTLPNLPYFLYFALTIFISKPAAAALPRNCATSSVMALEGFKPLNG